MAGLTRAWARRHLGSPYGKTEAWILLDTPGDGTEPAYAGIPHYLGPRLSFIEVQEPSDHIVIPETSGADDEGATMGLGWELALDMIDAPAARRRHGVLRRHRAGGGACARAASRSGSCAAWDHGRRDARDDRRRDAEARRGQGSDPASVRG